MPGEGCLAGKKVLLVEDESMVSILAEDILIDAGCEVVLAMRLGEALALAAAAELDLAILDINLGGSDTSYPVADELIRRGIPFVFASGYDASGMDERFRDRPRLQKPYAAATLASTAAAALKSD